ncbi:hypothetical protein SAMN02745121_07054 [Nannocystis exedens]|uniref:Lipoprotein n=1 Tax=Nannocystis exedens TaxID=54 RepID=A0A1I2G5X1_9BACT|nr:hypothetical protein [Nannocystis exedens]PCC67299.1 hypothetical protein NAEX_00302 [Nannocystis exedens]SFF12523.1 hypothetical protein SAMN02745121_07054 [Nannocystis exedens]
MPAVRLRAVLTVAVAAGSGFACHRSSPPAPVTSDPAPDANDPALPPGSPAYSAPLCSHDQLLGGLEPTHTNTRFEHALLRETVLKQTDTGVRPQQSQTLASVGLACQTVTDVPACARLLASTVATTSLFAGSNPLQVRYLVLQSGANVRPIATRSQLLTLLGAIDTPGEARLLAATLGVQPLCGDDSVRSIDGGYRVITKRSQAQCTNQYDGVIVDVVRGQPTIVNTVDLRDRTLACTTAPTP